MTFSEFMHYHCIVIPVLFTVLSPDKPNKMYIENAEGDFRK